MEIINSWKDIQWHIIERRIFRLQLRIFKASTNQEWEKMYKLQRCLISSKSAKYLSVKKVIQDNQGKKTAGVDGIIIKTPKEQFDLANQLKLDGKSSPILRTYIRKSDGTQCLFGIPTIEDRAKQMLASLAICPQWEAHFEAGSYGFRPRRSVADATEALFLGIAKKPKWVLNAYISKRFDRIDHIFLLEKCNTFPEMRKQICAWLKVGILDGEKYAFPEMFSLQGGIISPLLTNIALHGLREKLDEHIITSQGRCVQYRQTLTFIRYADDFILMHPNKKILTELLEVTQQFLKPIGLELHPTKTRIIHTLNPSDSDTSPPGFTFLGFDVIQRKIWNRQRRATTKRKSNQPFITLITPSKEGVKRHKKKIRDTIRKLKGVSQERLITKLNPIIRRWALLKRTQSASKIFQDLDSYLWKCLWNWACRRHPKMSRVQVKKKYWHQLERNNWVFGVKKGDDINLRIQLYSKIPIQRHGKVKRTASTFDVNLVY